jgi:predicted metal-binding membrane protein
MFNVQAIKQPAPLAFLLALVAAFAVAVAGTIHFCRSMSGGMDMPGGWTMSMMWIPMPGYTWTGSAVMFLFVWLVMMIAMMLPSALPMLMNVRRPPIRNFEALALFAALGYFLVWTLIGGIVYALGVAYALETMRLDWLSRLTPMLSGVTLMVCGMIQFTPWKLSALRQCRAPDCGALLHDGAFLARLELRTPPGSILRHLLYRSHASVARIRSDEPDSHGHYCRGHRCRETSALAGEISPCLWRRCACDRGGHYC